MNVSHCLSFLWPSFNSWPWWSISRNFSLADRACCLVHSLERLKVRPTTESLIESRVAPPEWHPRVAPLVKKMLPISNDGPNRPSSAEMSTDQPTDGLWRTEKESLLAEQHALLCYRALFSGSCVLLIQSAASQLR